MKAELSSWEPCGVDGGVNTFLTVYDLVGRRLIKIGDGLAQYIDNRFQVPRRRLHRTISTHLASGMPEEHATIVCLRQAMHKLQLAQDAYITVGWRVA